MNLKRKLSFITLIILGAAAIAIAKAAMPKAHGETLFNPAAPQLAEADTGPASPNIITQAENPLLFASATSITNIPPAPPSFLTGPAAAAISFLGQGSNWMIAPYAIYDTGSKSAGGGIGAGYKVSEFLVPTLRVDYINGHVWMPSGSLQVQAPLTLMGKVTVIPFAFSGIATPISGRGTDNGSPVGIFGAGGAVQIGKKFDVIADIEKWSSFAGNQYRLGFVYKF